MFAAVPALAAEISPDEYKAQVEPICKDLKSKEKILEGARKNVKTGKLTEASRQLLGAAKALKKARTELLQVPKPAEDAVRLTKWLKGVKTEIELLEAAGRKLAKGETNGASKMIIRLQSNARKTNNLVLDYEFRYCKFEPNKFI
ncbi:MAG TPA: hypothetical protein VFJ76_05685 [Solirubrobacterales bacterium]|nr:hypothetical protein [Solirubrobacterales bacterium]